MYKVLSNDDISATLSTSHDLSERPSPEDFVQYFPWACLQLQIPDEVVIIDIQNKVYNRATAEKSRQMKQKTIFGSKSQIMDLNLENLAVSRKNVIKPKNFVEHEISQNAVKIFAIYDNSANLVQLKFDNNRKVPRAFFKIIGLILKYHVYLREININRGINNISLHELNKLLSLSNITDLCLDGTAIINGNYDIFLEGKNKLRQLSLSRCRLDDKTVENIAQYLKHPLPASSMLSLLNLASNKITVNGAKFLAVALRTNRQLVYLNLADNLITDDGAIAILDVLKEFPLDKEEIISSKGSHLRFLREKELLINEIILELKTDSFDRKKQKRRSIKPTNDNQLRRGKDEIDDAKSQPQLDTWWRDKATAIAETKMSGSVGPFFPDNVKVKDDQIYCYGNNHLANLNLSYNDITYFSIKKILGVLSYQKLLNKKPRGLVNVSIEGNQIPAECTELEDIDAILMSYIANNNKRLSIAPKKKLKNSILH